MGKKRQLIDKMRLSVAVVSAKSVTFLVRWLRLGAASVLPGEMARRIQPQVLQQLSCQVKRGSTLR